MGLSLFARRGAAFLLDLTLIGLACAFTMRGFVLLQHHVEGSGATPHWDMFRKAVVWTIFTTYMTLAQWYGDGVTPGKKALGIVAKNLGAEPWTISLALTRTMAYQVSYFSGGLGFAWSLARADGRTLHDLLTGTNVVAASAATIVHEGDVNFETREAA